MMVINRVRTINVYILAFALLFILQKYTFGLMPGFRDIVVFGRFYLHELLFIFTSVLFIIFFVRAGVSKKK